MTSSFQKFLPSLVIAIATSLLTTPSFAQKNLPTTGYRMDVGGIQIETLVTEASTDEEAQIMLDGVAAQIQKDRALNPDAIIELGWVESDLDGRNPAQLLERLSKAKKFTSDLFKKLSSKKVSVDSASGIKIPAAKLTAKDSWYTNHSKVTSVVIRLATPFGVSIGTLWLAGLSPTHAFEVSLALGVACGLSAGFNDQILDFVDNVRIYKSKFARKTGELYQKTKEMMYKRVPKMASFVDKTKAALADRPIEFLVANKNQIHGYANWWLSEIAFGVVITGGEYLTRHMLGLPFEFSPWLFLLNASLSTASQGSADLGVINFKKLQNLIQSYNGGDPNDPVFHKRMLAQARIYGTAASIASVVGFTSANAQFLPVKIMGYGALAALGVWGYVFNQKLTKQIKLLEANPACNAALGDNAAQLFDEAG